MAGLNYFNLHTIVVLIAAFSWHSHLLGQTLANSSADTIVVSSDLETERFVQLIGLPYHLDNFNKNRSLAAGFGIDFLPNKAFLLSVSTLKYVKTSLTPNYDPNSWVTQGDDLPDTSIPVNKTNGNFSLDADLTFFLIESLKKKPIVRNKNEQTTVLNQNKKKKFGLSAGWRFNHYLIDNENLRFIAKQVGDNSESFSFPQNKEHQTLLYSNVLKVGVKTLHSSIGRFRFAGKTVRITRFGSFYLYYLSTIQYQLSDVFAAVQEIETINGVQNQYARFSLQDLTPFAKRGFSLGFSQSLNINYLNVYFKFAIERQPNIIQNTQYAATIGLAYVILK